ncbi:IS110 family RNA-guided transposase [Aromatoleum toluclasticum]|uniref:IS110 family transposase n=1 Tax=Aromatoleum toluclasticum TaxID=92003 RepID=UPI000375ADCF|nr:IS110 family transposase [Aromatoleum toluclasticum]
MDERIKIYVGLDVHKESIAMAVADTGRQPARMVGTLPHDLNKLLKKLQALGEPSSVHVVYEAGPTGYGLQRALAVRGYLCEIIAPSLIPKRPGDRIKTDRRDCVRLAELSRAGELKAIWIPDPTDEAIRDLTRAREDAINARTQVRQQLKSFLLRHEIRYPGKTAWTQSFHRWLGTLRLEAVSSQEAFVEYRLAVEAADKRVERMTMAMLSAIEGWRFESVVKALCALRGVDMVSAISLVAEIGDIDRFDHPRKLMGYLGLVPSERSSGDRVSRGSITKTGNAHARRLLTEAAWSYRFKPKIGYPAQRRQQDLPDPIRGIAWKAQLRLTERFAKLHARGLTINKVCVAVARELAGFVWAIAREPQAVAQPNWQASET